jgi:Protein of unknown function (DUF4231)
MGESQSLQEEKKQQALKECMRLEKNYESASAAFQSSYFLSQFVAVVFSGITPILILMDNVPKYVQAVPPALASISAGVSVYDWRLNWARNRFSSESLKSERLNFDMRVTSDYDSKLTDEAALGNFRKNVMSIHHQAMREWEQAIVKQDMSGEESTKNGNEG